ncbi:hypothetical protein KIS1582_4948 [Cytobacillus firmus]|uniref:Uncharacterized protein n=1 Tax=Cytobacillus firmus TaxID=1399 RepID=A0A800N806_CYTFI|nr:hypothetical protein KIS1582_4948 [Cytobacillus firmus]
MYFWKYSAKSKLRPGGIPLTGHNNFDWLPPDGSNYVISIC